MQHGQPVAGCVLSVGNRINHVRREDNFFHQPINQLFGAGAVLWRIKEVQQFFAAN
jgi:hypothetical protein